MKHMVLVVIIASLLTGCAGRQAKPVGPHIIRPKLPARVYRLVVKCGKEKFDVVNVLFTTRTPGFDGVDFWVRKYDHETGAFILEPFLQTQFRVFAEDNPTPKLVLKIGQVVTCKASSELIKQEVVDEASQSSTTNSGN